MISAFDLDDPHCVRARPRGGPALTLLLLSNWARVNLHATPGRTERRTVISRLATIAPDLVASLEHQQPRRLRLVAASAAGLAVERVRLSDPRLEAALGALREGRLGDTSERAGVQCLAREIDEIAWDAQERAENGDGSRETYVIAFRKARAAAAVGFALEADALTAALGAVYEAHAAVKDLQALRSVVITALGEP